LLSRAASGTWASASIVVSGKVVANYASDSGVPVPSLAPSDVMYVTQFGFLISSQLYHFVALFALILGIVRND
jgi:hypothetical protein